MPSWDVNIHLSESLGTLLLVSSTPETSYNPIEQNKKMPREVTMIVTSVYKNLKLSPLWQYSALFSSILYLICFIHYRIFWFERDSSRIWSAQSRLTSWTGNGTACPHRSHQTSRFMYNVVSQIGVRLVFWGWNRWKPFAYRFGNYCTPLKTKNI